jgi:hypothetical protein
MKFQKEGLWKISKNAYISSGVLALYVQKYIIYTDCHSLLTCFDFNSMCIDID